VEVKIISWQTPDHERPAEANEGNEAAKGFPDFVALVSFCGTGPELFQFALESINFGGGECVGRDIALRCPRR
jgi:hypothetical protein